MRTDEPLRWAEAQAAPRHEFVESRVEESSAVDSLAEEEVGIIGREPGDFFDPVSRFDRSELARKVEPVVAGRVRYPTLAAIAGIAKERKEVCPRIVARGFALILVRMLMMVRAELDPCNARRGIASIIRWDIVLLKTRRGRRKDESCTV